MRSFVIVGALFLAACGGHDEGDIDDVIGAACSTDRDCDSRCFSGGHFPGGFCSLSCASDNDCPSHLLYTRKRPPLRLLTETLLSCFTDEGEQNLTLEIRDYEG